MGAPVSVARSLRSVALLGVLSSLACREAPHRTCVESLCFEWAEAHETQSQGHKHKLTSALWGGAWLDVQSWEPGPGAPTDIAGVQRSLSRMRELTATARTSTMASTTVAGTAAAVEDATIEWRGQRYRRMTWVIPRAPRWVAVDVTAPVAEWDRSAPRLRAMVAQAAWESPVTPSRP